MIRKSVIAAVSAATCGAALLGVAPAAAQQRQLPSLQQAYPQESYTQYRYRDRYERPRYSRYHGRSYRRGDGLAAGVAGLAAGALIGGAIASAQQPVYAAPRRRHMPLRKGATRIGSPIARSDTARSIRRAVRISATTASGTCANNGR